jgi:hypothetical protein
MRLDVRLSQYFCLAIAIASLTACTTPSQPKTQFPEPQLKTVAVDKAKVAVGQTIYVPIYSHIYTVNRSRKMNLTATLSIRNTDLTNPMILASVDYYDTAGKLVRKYLENPVELGPLASTDFVIEQDDTSGGAGANFVVDWVAEAKITEPIVEAVMLDTVGNQGISFISPGRVIKNQAAAQ